MTDTGDDTRGPRPDPSHGSSPPGKASPDAPRVAGQDDVDQEIIETADVPDDPDALRKSVLGGAGQRSGSGLDGDRGYGAGNAARDAHEEGGALDEGTDPPPDAPRSGR